MAQIFGRLFNARSAQQLEQLALLRHGAEIKGHKGAFVRQGNIAPPAQALKTVADQIGGEARQLGGLDQLKQGFQVVLDQIVRMRIFC